MFLQFNWKFFGLIIITIGTVFVLYNTFKDQIKWRVIEGLEDQIEDPPEKSISDILNEAEQTATTTRAKVKLLNKDLEAVDSINQEVENLKMALDNQQLDSNAITTVTDTLTSDIIANKHDMDTLKNKMNDLGTIHEDIVSAEATYFNEIKGKMDMKGLKEKKEDVSTTFDEKDTELDAINTLNTLIKNKL
jgi:hypothetical protein